MTGNSNTVEYNDLERFARSPEHRLLHKPPSYFEVYERHCARFRNKPVKLLEFGVFHGGSLQMWKSYLGKDCEVWGVDINSICKDFEEERVTIRIGDQEDRVFLGDLAKEIGEIDIIIDDGGHTMAQQITTFEELFPSLRSNGVYICEDVGTSYRQSHGGGYSRPGTFIEYCKMLCDKVNIGDWPVVTENDNSMLAHLRWAGDKGPAKFMEAKKSIWSISFYTSIVAIERRWSAKSGVGEMFGKPSY